MKQWISNLFSGRKTTGYSEWRTENSILSYISPHLDREGKLIATACDLPDEIKDDEQLRFAPGFMDAMYGAKQSEDSDELAELLETITDKGDKRCE